MEGESLCPVPDVQGQSHWGACGHPWLAALRQCTPSACESPRALESGSKQAPKIVQASEDKHLLPHPSAEPAPTQVRGAEMGEGEGRNGNMPVALGVTPMPHKASPASLPPGSGGQGSLLLYGKQVALYKHISIRIWSVHPPGESALGGSWASGFGRLAREAPLNLLSQEGISSPLRRELHSQSG